MLDFSVGRMVILGPSSVGRMVASPVGGASGFRVAHRRNSS